MEKTSKDSVAVEQNVANSVEKNFANICNPAQIGVPHYSSKCAKIEKIENYILASSFLLLIGVWIIANFTLAIIAFLLGVIALIIYKSMTERKKFQTEADYILYKELKQQQTNELVTSYKKQREIKKNTEVQRNSSDALACPKCGSQQIHVDKRGFKLGRAVGVGILTGGIGGVVAGAVGRNKIMITCLHCGHQWKAGK